MSSHLHDVRHEASRSSSRWICAAARHVRRPARPRVVLALLAGIGVALVAGGTAYGSYSSFGQGASSASTATLQPVTVTALTGGDSPATMLQPGGSADVILRISNPNAFAVTLVGVTGNGTITATGGSGVCATTGVAFGDETGLSTPVAADGTTLVDLPGAATMGPESSSGCQGAAFSIPVAIVVHES